MDLRSTGTLKSLFVPGGILLLAAVILLSGGFLSISAAAVDFYYYLVFAAGILLSWRFHSNRVLFALIMLLLGHRAIEFFSAGRAVAIGPGRIAFEAIAFLLPINFIVLSLGHERGLSIPAVTPRLVLLFLESVFVAVDLPSRRDDWPCISSLRVSASIVISLDEDPSACLAGFRRGFRGLAGPVVALRQAA